MIKKSRFEEARQVLTSLQPFNPSSQLEIEELYKSISQKETEEKETEEKEIQKQFDEAYNEQNWSKVIKMYREHHFLSKKVSNRKKKENAIRGSKPLSKHIDPKSEGIDDNKGAKIHSGIKDGKDVIGPSRKRKPERDGKQPSVKRETSIPSIKTQNTKSIIHKPKR